MKTRIIRDAKLGDAEAISQLIIQTLKETNAKDYSQAVIEEVIKNFSPAQITARIKQREVFVVEQEDIIATASLEKNMVRSVFVLPSKQDQHIGSLLMHHLEKIAKQKNILVLIVPSSITAEGFYRKLGYTAVRDEYYGEERTIIMEKYL